LVSVWISEGEQADRVVVDVANANSDCLAETICCAPILLSRT
jgi:hypothetical protein